jgi:hypothetical protein
MVEFKLKVRRESVSHQNSKTTVGKVGEWMEQWVDMEGGLRRCPVIERRHSQSFTAVEFDGRHCEKLEVREIPEQE